MDIVLGQNVMQAESSGMPKKMIQTVAVQIGEYLATNVDPKTNKSECCRIYGALPLKMKTCISELCH